MAAVAGKSSVEDILDAEVEEVPLNLEAVIGFNGKLKAGLIQHPDGEHILYPLGSTVVIRNIKRNTQSFLQGHTDRVTCIAISPDGKYAASGQVASMGFRAPVIVWDVEAGIRNANTSDRTGELVHTLMLHKTRVQDVSFSHDNHYLASLGGQDDNTLVVWDVDAGEPICGAPAASHAQLCVEFYHGDSMKMVTAGQYSVKTWTLDLGIKRVQAEKINLAGLQRTFTSVAIDETDTFAWCGTRSGDVLEINLESLRYTRASKNRFVQGVAQIQQVPGPPGGDDYLIVGNGDGSICRLNAKDLSIDKAMKLMGAVTSVALDAMKEVIFAGTSDGNIYRIPIDTFKPSLRSTAHTDPISDIVFPRDCPELFLTCSKSQVRLWNAETRRELLRIQVPNLQCNCACVTPSGDAILTGWDDGKIRAFTPEKGRVIYVIHDAHAVSVTSIAVTGDGGRVISGGQDGRVRVWDVSGKTQKMMLSFKEHKKAVTSIDVAADGEECVSSSSDGSCVVWNLRRGTRQNALFASTVFGQVQYHPDESQLVTCGSDRKIGYWDTVDCSPIRQLEASTSALTALHLDRDARTFAVAGADRTVKVWMYDEGVPIAFGKGHSGTISKVRFSPDGSYVVSVGEEGGIFIWTAPRIPAAFATAEEGAGAAEEAASGAGKGGGYAGEEEGYYAGEGKEEGYYGEEGAAAGGGGGGGEYGR